MRRLLALLVAAAAIAVPLSSAGAAPQTSAASQTRVGDLPADAPPALYRAEPKLPRPHGWPGADAFPRTSGTGRLADGGFFWTDFLYDDHGAIGKPSDNPVELAGSPPWGTYGYTDPAAHNDGADIFGAAVQLTPSATYWRVDWLSLADPRVPVAEWAFDTDDNSATGASTWPAAAGVRSAGTDRALVVSSRGAWLYDAATNRVLAHLSTAVDRRTNSFIVRVPRTVLPVGATWRLRLAAGLANADGTGFAPADGALPGETNVYNVAFRSRTQEPVGDDYWDDLAQAKALTTGDVSAFSHTVRWADLAHHRITPQARPTGWSDRWYVSSADLGAGVIASPSSISDGEPNYLGRIQPYAVYVPHTYTGRTAVPLTFLLHSLTQNQNQYAATTPKFVQQACEQRDSICVTTLGRGPDGDYHDYAELDFWEVWAAVARTYHLDPDRTVLSGYSMGGIGSNQLATEHPDLFARSVTYAGGVGDVPQLANLQWVPTYLAGGAEDELVPVTTQRAEADALDALGYRYRWIVYPAIDHVAFELSDELGDGVAYMGNAKRTLAPGHVRYVWSPKDDDSLGGLSVTQRPDLGVGTTGAYWLRDLAARSRTELAKVDAVSGERPDPAVTPVRTSGVDPTTPLEPAYYAQLGWRTGARPAPSPTLSMTLHNVGAVRIDLPLAGFTHGRHGTLRLTTDGPVAVRIGTTTHRFTAGTHVVPFVA